MSRGLDVVRILCGGLIFIFGLMGLGLFGWEPPVASPPARPFQLAMQNAGYFMPFMTATFLITGLSFVFDKFGALASIVLFPISLNILLFHIVLEPNQLIASIVLFVINIVLFWIYRSAYQPLLKPRV